MSGPPDNEQRPRCETESAAGSLGGDGISVTRAHDLGRLDAVSVAFCAGYDTGYAHGRNDRRKEAEAVRLHEAAAEIVLRMARLPEAPAPSPGREVERERALRGPIREGRRSA